MSCNRSSEARDRSAGVQDVESASDAASEQALAPRESPAASPAAEQDAGRESLALLPVHLQIPQMRRVEGHAIEHEGRQLVALYDIAQISDRPCVVSHPAVVVLEHFDGETHLTDLVERFGVSPDDLVALVRHLDEQLLLHGPRFDAFLAQMRQDYDARPYLPMRAAAEVTEQSVAAALGAVPARSAVGRIAGIVAPHLDFERGRRNYATAWRLVSDHVGRGGIDRVIVFGTNHFGQSTGAVLCDRGLQTRFGMVHVDRELIDVMHRTDRGLVRRLLDHRLDNAREHSIELQGPWIRHVLGPEVRVCGFLMHDPTYKRGQSYDGRGVNFDSVIGLLREVLDVAGGQTLLVASADLSHVGLQFGDAQPNTEAFLAEVEAHDQQHLDLLVRSQLPTFLSSMTRCRNRTRWCTIGGMAAVFSLLPEARPRLLSYEQASDLPESGACCVTSAAMSLEVRSAPGGNADSRAASNKVSHGRTAEADLADA